MKISYWNLAKQCSKEVAMVGDIGEFETMRKRLGVLEDIEAASEDISQDRVYSQEEAEARLLTRLLE